MNLADYKALSFDCYGTLIDWEAGIAAVLAPWAREVGLDLDDERLLLAYAGSEAAVEQAMPTARYPEVLAMAFRRTGELLGRPVDDAWASRLGDSVPEWPAFPDSAAALASLATHYQLIVVSNVHRDGFAASNNRLRGRFAAIITAEDVQAYKPAEPHFRALLGTLDDLGIARGELLHVAQSLFHDHVPAHRAGLRSVWINRRHDRLGWGATPEPSEAWSYDQEFASLGEFAAAASAAFAEEGSQAIGGDQVVPGGPLADGIAVGDDGVARCRWGAGDPLYRRYHDEEWGRPVADDRRLFEKLSLEGFQAGLSWLTILRKREHFRRAFDGFDPAAVARFGPRQVDRLLADPGIVRNRAKIEATVNNARRYAELAEEFGSLAAYVWRFEPGPQDRPPVLDQATLLQLGHSPESKAMSKDLRRRGWSFVGPTTAYAFMQAMGLVNDHLEGCDRRPPVERERQRFRRPRVRPRLA